MRLSTTTVAPIALFLLGGTLLISGFSSAATKPAAPELREQQTLPKGSSPACTDLSQVNGPVIEFGFEGKAPYSVAIDAKGEITAKGVRNLQQLPPVPLPFGFERHSVSPSTVKALVRLANANDFWKLPSAIGRDSRADTVARFMTVNLSCARRRVVVKEASNTSPEVQRFAEMYMLLSDLVYDEPAMYKPLQ